MMEQEIYQEHYKHLADIPSLANAEFLRYSMSNEQFIVKVSWKHRNLLDMEFQTLSQNYVVRKNELLNLPPAESLPSIILQRCSPNGDKEALILKKEEGYVLVVITNDKKWRPFNLSKNMCHGNIYADPYISTLSWSSDENFLVYLAEEPQPEGTDFFNDSNKESLGRGKKYLYRDDWGEQMEGQHQSVIVRVDTVTGEQKVFRLEKGLTAGEVQFVPNSSDIIGIANPAGPFRLGRAYSSDRESMIFLLTSEGDYKELTPRGQHVEKLRFSCDGKKLVFVQSSTFGAVAPTAQICLMDWDTKQISLTSNQVMLSNSALRVWLQISNIIHSLNISQETFLQTYVPVRYRLADGQTFCGICPKTVLPMRCWDSSGTRFYFSALDLNTLHIYEFDISTKNIRRVKHSQSLTVLDVVNEKFLAKESSVLEPDRLVWGEFPPLSNFFDVDLHYITKNHDVPALSQLSYDIFEFNAPGCKSETQLTISAMYIGPTKRTKSLGGKLPLILWPHGGPHSIRPNAFDYMFATLVMSGYAILLPNYRGSTGMGAHVMTGSIGSCGIDDINDCKLALDICLKKYDEVLDKNRVYGIGLSHGGFLVAHLMAKYPDLFNATCLMNPATDIVSIANSSDIPEWAYLEFGSTYEIGRTMDSEALNILHDRSPIKYIDSVKTPTLILLGNQDRRCPNSQGLHYHKLLMARNVPTRVFIYDDNHPLLRLSSEADGLMQIFLWFASYE